MSKSFKCDVCGSHYEPYEGLNTVQFSEKHSNGKWGKLKESLDVCPECLESIKEYLRENGWVPRPPRPVEEPQHGVGLFAGMNFEEIEGEETSETDISEESSSAEASESGESSESVETEEETDISAESSESVETAESSESVETEESSESSETDISEESSESVETEESSESSETSESVETTTSSTVQVSFSTENL